MSKEVLLYNWFPNPNLMGESAKTRVWKLGDRKDPNYVQEEQDQENEDFNQEIIDENRGVDNDTQN